MTSRGGRGGFRLAAMRVFGIDCGTEFTGYGVVEMDAAARDHSSGTLRHLAAGTIRLSKKEKTPQRLAQVYAELVTALMGLHAPDCVAIEEVFFSANAKSALKLGQVRGVAMLAAATCGLPVAEYAPLTIKSSVTGYGLAAKEQVQFMVTRLLALECAPESADAADALAIAICHIHTAQTLMLQGRGAVRAGAAGTWVVATLSFLFVMVLGAAGVDAGAGGECNACWCGADGGAACYSSALSARGCRCRSSRWRWTRAAEGDTAAKQATPVVRGVATEPAAQAFERSFAIPGGSAEKIFRLARQAQPFQRGVRVEGEEHRRHGQQDAAV
jgi:crossover junction endodeoxyribonuclease RuvC